MISRQTFINETICKGSGMENQEFYFGKHGTTNDKVTLIFFYNSKKVTLIFY